ncbi:MAG: SdpI family protein [Cyclobacteriaceae bacterium]|nr:SdpI family protein [Cyclobacteriaceae bacterium]UYN86662.1 MAG: SdpI family protein [Cyclobacteriaceae bacterium]
MKLLYIHLMLGPLMVVLSYIFKRFPPKKINHIYGYRTPRSMRSQEAWDCANLYCPHVFLIVSILTCVVQLVTYSLMPAAQSIMWSSGFLVVGLIAVIPLTEVHLKKKGFN